MSWFKNRKFVLLALPLCILAFQISAAEPDSEAGVSSGSMDKDPPKLSRAEEIASRFSITSGLGFIKAYKTSRTGSLAANGVSDVKVSYFLTALRQLRERHLYLSLHYFPFSIGPSSTENGVTQEYAGDINPYTVGAELELLTHKKFELLGSFEAGIYTAQFSELIPVSESSRPIRRYGGIAAIGAEGRYKVFEKFHTGLRLYWGVGHFTFTSILLSASLLF